MTAREIRLHDGKYKYLFELPCGYGYAMMLEMSQFVIDTFLGGKISSFRVSLLPGRREREFKFLLRLHKNRIDKCNTLQAEMGVIYLKGKSLFLEDEIEVVWFNQTNIIGVAGNYGDKYHIYKVEMMLDKICALL